MFTIQSHLMRFLLTTLLTCIILSPQIIAQSTHSNLERQLTIVNRQSAINIDGNISEQEWKSVTQLEDFIGNFPLDDVTFDTSLQTVVKITGDENYIYVAAKCYTQAPFTVYGLKRDNEVFFDGDLFGIVIDGTNNQNNGYVFAVNPEGVQLEGIISNQSIGKESDIAQRISISWNVKWQSATRKENNAWTTEIRIPIQVLRFSKSKQWGINFLRRHAATNTHQTWSPVPKQFHEISLNHLGIATWNVLPSNSQRNIGISPYLLNNTEKVASEEKVTNTFKAGVDARVGLSTRLSLDLSINPDFSQIEVDELITNLTTANLRFPEKRLFFQENDDIFSDFGIAPMRPFFSRRIGLDESGRTIPILFGGRLSGFLTDKIRIGVMNMHTDSSDDTPAKNYSSTAIHYQLNKQFLIKSYFHNVQEFGGTSSIQDEYNRLGGIEAKYVSNNGKWRASLGNGLSLSPEHRKKNQFPKLELGYYSKSFNIFTNIARVGDNYINEIGFLPRMFHFDAVEGIQHRLGFTHYYTAANYFIYPKSSKVNRHDLGLITILSQVHDGRFFRKVIMPIYTINFQNTSSLRFIYRMEQPELLFPFTFTDATPLAATTYNYGFGSIIYKSDKRKVFKYELLVQNGQFFNGNQQRYAIDLGYRIPPGLVFSLVTDYNNIKLPESHGDGEFWSVGLKTEIGFSSKLFWTSWFQLNTQRKTFNINSRLQYQLNALSNFFLVYTDNYLSNPWTEQQRSLVFKLNYWLDI